MSDNNIKVPLRSLECAFCSLPFSNPYMLPCGHSFDKHCLEGWKKSTCPNCEVKYDITTIPKNISLAQVAEEPVEVNTSVVELLLVDESTSMWYSDGILSFLGTARMEIAKNLLRQFFQDRQRATKKDKNHVVVFGSFSTGMNILFRSDKDDWKPLVTLEQVQPNGPETALFDAVVLSLQFLETHFSKHEKRLVVITDGKDNFSSEKNKTDQRFNELQNLQKELQVHSLMIGVGGNFARQKEVADKLDFQYTHLDAKNLNIVLKGIKSRFPTPSEMMEAVKMRLNLPNVPQEQPETWIDIPIGPTDSKKPREAKSV